MMAAQLNTGIQAELAGRPPEGHRLQLCHPAYDPEAQDESVSYMPVYSALTLQQLVWSSSDSTVAAVDPPDGQVPCRDTQWL